MSTLSTFWICVGLAGALHSFPAAHSGRLLSVTHEVPAPGAPGYFFSLREVPLSQKQYVFLADPLKKATLYDGEKNVVLSHTMTVKNPKGFDMYFSAADYNVVLALREAKEVGEGSVSYKGTMLVRHGSDKRKFAIHGFQNR
jgi:hypothetical protein